MSSDDPAIMLGGAVMREALKDDGPCYFMQPCGIWWANLLGLDPVFLYEKGAGLGVHKDIPYAEMDCRHRPEVKTSAAARKFVCAHGISPRRASPWLFERSGHPLTC